MSKYILLYKGPATPMEDIDPVKLSEIGAAWGRWIESCGSSLTDVGLPMAEGWAVSDQGKQGPATQLNGYSIVEAANKDEVNKLIQGHPFLSDATGDFWVESYELLPMPAM